MATCNPHSLPQPSSTNTANMPPRRRARDMEPDSDPASERKKLRNRLSQQAFRQRQNAHIKELEKRVERAGATENERIAELEKENQCLRKQLTTFINKLASAQASLQDLSQLVQISLDANEVKDTPMLPDENVVQDANMIQEEAAAENAANLPRTQPPSDAISSFETESPHHLWSDHVNESITAPSDQSCAFTKTFDFLTDTFRSPTQTQRAFANAEQDALQEMIAAADLALHRELPGVWTFNYQMGPLAYSHAMARSPSLFGSITISNSTFSNHISSIRGCIWEKWQHIGLTEQPDAGLPKLHQAISLMLSMFQGLNRPLAVPWYTPTRIYKHVASLLAWQLHPTREMYAHLHPNFRPTALQVSESYPAIIDWCLLPSVRDRLILTYAANSRLDDVILDISHAYCVEADLSTLVSTAPYPTPGFVCLWDVIQAMGDDHSTEPTTAPLGDAQELPAPSPTSLFTSPALARLAFRQLRMDAGLGVFKLDPAFFAKYPELYSPELVDVLAVGAALRPPGKAGSRLPPPPERIEAGTVRLYRHLADWVVNVVCDEPW